jgi:DNA adenine methylase
MHQYLKSPQGISYIPSHHVSFPESGYEPFLKWPGGKRWISSALASIINGRLKNRYYEPFLGGGAIFFALHPLKATISDINEDLINTYIQVRDRPYEIIEELKKIPVTKENYYKIRENEPKDSTKRAIRFLFLNRTAFGGIYRLNLNGKFNVPYGGGERTPEPLWSRGLVKRASEVLKGVRIVASDFENIIDKAGKGDVVYCDPTYTVAHNNNGFIRYNERNFSWDDQERLATAAFRACERGALVLISNACCYSLKNLYGPFKPKVLIRKSLISCKSEARREINEYLFILDPNEIQ